MLLSLSAPFLSLSILGPVSLSLLSPALTAQESLYWSVMGCDQSEASIEITRPVLTNQRPDWGQCQPIRGQDIISDPQIMISVSVNIVMNNLTSLYNF